MGTGVRAERHLSLDQSMIMGALVNVLLGGILHDWFGTSAVEEALRPVIAQERFGAGGLTAPRCGVVAPLSRRGPAGRS